MGKNAKAMLEKFQAFVKQNCLTRINMEGQYGDLILKRHRVVGKAGQGHGKYKEYKCVQPKLLVGPWRSSISTRTATSGHVGRIAGQTNVNRATKVIFEFAPACLRGRRGQSVVMEAVIKSVSLFSAMAIDKCVP